MAELMGREGGLCRGLGGSMHLVDVEHGLLGATGVVGGNVPLALGSALAGRMLGGEQVAVVFFGDGAVQGGIFLESVNLATLWRLPAILVCENNGSPSSHRARPTPSSSASAMSSRPTA
jgi:Pyruvate/2-oxoglutarate dehydrogenase complex, dehydrogenase (E1) component, eukaryotic type, alpha subunit